MEKKQEVWDNFVIQNQGLFLQSWAWGRFQESLGNKVWYLQDEKKLWQALVIQRPLPFNQNYLYVPRGPIFAKAQLEVYQRTLAQLKGLAKEQKSIFLKLEPNTNNRLIREFLRTNGFVFAPKQVQPKKTVILDLTRSEKEIFASFKPKTRYNIRLAVKKGVTIKQAKSLADFDKFILILKQTAQRSNFRLHPENYYLSLWQRKLTELYLAEYQKEIIAGIMVNFFGSQASYLHGGLNYQYRWLMAPFLLQWQAIKKAKEKQMLRYDLWGIDEQKYCGVTRFKLGFDGEILTLPGAWDLPLKFWWYQAYKIGRKIF